VLVVLPEVRLGIHDARRAPGCDGQFGVLPSEPRSKASGVTAADDNGFSIGFVFVHEPDEIGGVLQSLVDGEEFQVFGGPVSEGLGRAVVAVFQRDEVGFVTGADHVGKHLLLIHLASVFPAEIEEHGSCIVVEEPIVDEVAHLESSGVGLIEMVDLRSEFFQVKLRCIYFWNVIGDIILLSIKRLYHIVVFGWFTNLNRSYNNYAQK
jgi:hypothetical protein|tara:strand:+ start:96 stop:719 length:624 start_codon:yes stop_codon:yes gene_type:complete